MLSVPEFMRRFLHELPTFFTPDKVVEYQVVFKEQSSTNWLLFKLVYRSTPNKIDYCNCCAFRIIIK